MARYNVQAASLQAIRRRKNELLRRDTLTSLSQQLRGADQRRHDVHALRAIVRTASLESCLLYIPRNTHVQTQLVVFCRRAARHVFRG